MNNIKFLIITVVVYMSFVAAGDDGDEFVYGENTLNFFEQCQKFTKNDTIRTLVEPMLKEYMDCDKRDINLMEISRDFDSAVLGNSSTAIKIILDKNCPKFTKHFNCINAFYKNVTFCYDNEYFGKMNTQNKFFIELLHYTCDNDGENVIELWKEGGFNCLKKHDAAMAECLDDSDYINPYSNPKKSIRFEIMKIGSQGTCSVPSQKECIFKKMEDCLTISSRKIIGEIIDMFKVFADIACDQSLW